MRFVLGSFALVLFLGGCPKKTSNVVIEGWHSEEEWKGQCYYHKNFSVLGRAEVYDARQNSMSAMMSQWRGEREDGIQFDEGKVVDLETTMLGKIELVDVIAGQNQKHCIEHFSGKADPQAWKNWFWGINGILTAGDCKSQPLNYTLFDYLDIGKGWQISASVCEGDQVVVKGSTIDYYKVSDDGPWINIAGDLENRAMTDDYPCTLEGCFVGSLILRFTDEVGNETILPVGEETVFSAPVHGKIEVQINDSTYYDNVYKQEGSMIHHTSIEYNGEG
jgi:hypothetical protein